jgi:hypothetical protein
MPRPRLHSPDQPWPVRWLLRLYHAVASLQLAVVLLALLCVVLAWATFVESEYGTPAVRFGVYDTWWFIGLNGLLGLNVLAAALIRWPWKRHQTGFVVIHGGILVLLAGCVVGVVGGVDAKLPVAEGTAGYQAYEDTQHFELTVVPTAPADGDAAAEPETVSIPFRGGPFNWDDYTNRFWFPWHLAHRTRGVLYNRDGILLEALDYCSDSRRVPVTRTKLPQLTVDVSSPQDAADGATPQPAREMTLGVSMRTSPHLPPRPFGMGDLRPTPQGPPLVFWEADGRDETEAFLHSRPQGPLGKLGQVVLYCAGKTYRLSVDDLKKKHRQPLGDSGLDVELLRTSIDIMDNSLPGVQLQVYCPDEPPQVMKLHAYFPHMNEHDRLHGLFGSYWWDDAAADKDAAIRGPRGRRIDILLGCDRKLYYRVWGPPQVEAVAAWPQPGDADEGRPVSRITAFAGSSSPLAVSLKTFVPGDEPQWRTKPVPFEKDADRRAWPEHRARVHLTVDGLSQTFWLASDVFGNPQVDRRQVVEGKNRQVSVTLPADAIELGYEVALREFRHELAPGSGKAMNFSSIVELIDRETGESMRDDVLVTLNAPVDVTDPASGRRYRLSQVSYAGPFPVGSPQYRQYAGKDSTRARVSLSWLGVNSDPGRGLKYAGSLMICAGLVILYYMRAYFFRRQGPQRASA